MILSTDASTPVSIVNKTDPNYTDSCLKAGFLCELCCMVDKAWCSMDLAICDPVMERHLEHLWDAMTAVACVVIAFPIFCVLIYF